MPNKFNAKCRHHIPKMKFTVRNWAEYDAALRARGSLTLWVTDDAMDQWAALPRSTPGGQCFYSDLAIETSLMLRLVFRQPLRQTEGLMASIFELLGVDLKAPDHSTVSRRAMNLKAISNRCKFPAGAAHILIDSTGLKVFGAGEWLLEKHGQKSRRSWRKLHLAVDANTGQIVASILTQQDVDDPSQVGPLLDQIEQEIGQVTADGAYDGEPIYEVIAQRDPMIDVVIPPRVTAQPSTQFETSPSKRDTHLLLIQSLGRLDWQQATGYGKRALVETTMGRYKAIIGPRLRARHWLGQQAEAAMAVAVLNRMLAAGRPNSVRTAALAA
jgi:transposase